MKSLLVFADRQPGTRVSLDTAVALARANSGQITALVDTPIARYIAMDPMGGGVIAPAAMQDALAQDDAIAKRITDQLQETGLGYSVIRSEADPVDALANSSHLADLVVVARGSRIAGEVAMAISTPVLVVADDKPLLSKPRKICVAWDGGREGAFALRSAVPFLVGADEVNVLTVSETKKRSGLPVTEALRYLELYGITPKHHELARGSSTEETLANGVRDQGGELLVMGAYGHSRMRQFLFGGVTQHFLDATSGPSLLLAH